MPVMTKQISEPCPKGRYLAICGLVTVEEPRAGGKYEQKYPQFKYPFTIKKVLAAKPVKPTPDNPSPKQPEDWIGQTISGYTGTFLKEGSKGSLWAAALLDVDEDELPDEVDTDDYEGRFVELVVGRSETGNHKITELMPHIRPEPASKNGKARPVAVAEDDDDEEAELDFD
jgi:hypothetical protein